VAALQTEVGVADVDPPHSSPRRVRRIAFTAERRRLLSFRRSVEA
jgi:hypothetical protein